MITLESVARAAAIDPTAGHDPAAPASGTRSYSTQDAARLTGVPAHTLRWYERVGLLPGIARGDGGRRRFNEANLTWVRVLRALRVTGMPVATLRMLTDHQRAGNRSAGLELLQTHRAHVLAVLARLQRSLLVLDAVEGHLERAPRRLGDRDERG